MFTGLIESLCTIKAIRHGAVGATLSIDLGDIAKTAKLGESISVSGVCLTISKLAGTVAEFDVSHETVARSTIGKLAVGQKVNIEQAMQAQGRFGGHVVQGHVDGMASLKSAVKHGDFYDVTFATPRELLDEMVVKGSVAVDGISLTVSAMDKDSFTVAVIPVTWQNTTLGAMKPGQQANIETDIMIKTIKKQLRTIIAGQGLTAAKLMENGF